MDVLCNMQSNGLVSHSRRRRGSETAGARCPSNVRTAGKGLWLRMVYHVRPFFCGIRFLQDIDIAVMVFLFWGQELCGESLCI